MTKYKGFISVAICGQIKGEYLGERISKGPPQKGRVELRRWSQAVYSNAWGKYERQLKQEKFRLDISKNFHYKDRWTNEICCLVMRRVSCLHPPRFSRP